MTQKVLGPQVGRRELRAEDKSLSSSTVGGTKPISVGCGSAHDTAEIYHVPGGQGSVASGNTKAQVQRTASTRVCTVQQLDGQRSTWTMPLVQLRTRTNSPAALAPWVSPEVLPARGHHPAWGSTAST